jgi:hypothetical protein
MSFDHLNFEIGDNLSGMTSENKSTVPSIVIDASLTSDLLQNNLSETSNQSITSNNSGMHSSFYVSTGLSNGGNYTGSAITPLSSLSSNSVITPFKPDAPPFKPDAPPFKPDTPPNSPNPTLQQTMFPVPNSQAYVKGDLDQNEAAASNSSDDSSVVFISQTAASNSSDESSVVFISPTSASSSSREQANQQVDSDSTYLPSESGTSVTDDHHHQKRPRK